MVTTARSDPITPGDVLDAAERLAPSIAARADETEAARRVHRDVLDGLTTAGVFRVLRPPSVGGLGARLPDGLRVFEALARGDAA
ncbi:MAG TPA: acyl-CoA dehydrogenase family protein, partial [Miltoncostaea sp.]|nr:acyl-CoA dehydrogenase family protein [Miltoncostaea sp.]